MLSDPLFSLAVIFVLVILFLVGRSFVLWYWGIWRAIEALESIADSLSYLPAVQQGRQAKMQKQTSAPRRATN